MTDYKIESGTLYVVATPIGNLQDLSERAKAVLSAVDVIAAEDTRHSARLLQHLSISTRVVSYHDYSSPERLHSLISLLAGGASLAMISDAGTPGISDPGYELVRATRKAGLAVVPVPGPSAVIAALSVAGVPTDRFIFEGFLPAQRAARLKYLQTLSNEPRTLVFFESPHRITGTLEDFATVFGNQRELFIGRELTKKFETTFLAGISDCQRWVEQDPQQQKGEFVLVLTGNSGVGEKERQLQEGKRILKLLLDELPVSKAARLAASVSGASKNTLYRIGLESADPGKSHTH